MTEQKVLVLVSSFYSILVGGFEYFLLFTRILGKKGSRFHEYFSKTGWFNHQLAIVYNIGVGVWVLVPPYPLETMNVTDVEPARLGRFHWKREGISASIVTIDWNIPDHAPAGWYTIHYSHLVSQRMGNMENPFFLGKRKELMVA